MIARLITIACLLTTASLAETINSPHELRMSVDDCFIISPSNGWNIAIEKELSLRFANVSITPETGSGFDLMLYFKCDTPDLAQFNTPEKMERSVRVSSEKYIPAIQEKTITLKKLDIKGQYGFSTVMTDSKLASQDNIPKGEFRYITRGMIRLSSDSALGFSLMTNELDTPLHKTLLDYVFSFAKEKK